MCGCVERQNDLFLVKTYFGMIVPYNHNERDKALTFAVSCVAGTAFLCCRNDLSCLTRKSSTCDTCNPNRDGGTEITLE